MYIYLVINIFIVDIYNKYLLLFFIYCLIYYFIFLYISNKHKLNLPSICTLLRLIANNFYKNFLLLKIKYYFIFRKLYLFLIFFSINLIFFLILITSYNFISFINI